MKAPGKISSIVFTIYSVGLLPKIIFYIFSGKFYNYLTADTAWISVIIFYPNNGDSFNFLMTFRNGFEDSCSFSTISSSIRSIFYIATSIDCIVFSEYSSAYFKIRIWSIGISTSFISFFLLINRNLSWWNPPINLFNIKI